MTDKFKQFSPGQWVMGILASIVTVAIIWMATSVSTMTTDVALLQQQLKSMEKMITAQMSDRYTGAQAKSDKEMFSIRLDQVNERIGRMGKRIDAVFARLSLVERETRTK